MTEGLVEIIGPIVVGIFVGAADEGKGVGSFVGSEVVRFVFVGAADEGKGVGLFVGSEVVRLEDVVSVGDIDVNVDANAITDTLLLGEDVSGRVVGGIVGCKIKEITSAIQTEYRINSQTKTHQCTYWICQWICRTARRPMSWID